MAATNSAAAPAQAQSKKWILIGALGAVLVVALLAAGYWLMRQSQADPYGEDAPAKRAVVIPTFLPLENMVVNLADPGGDRFAQIGITLELQDEATANLVKQYMPSIRNSVLMLVSQRTADELLQREGKEQLASDILREVAKPLSAHSRYGRSDDEAGTRARDNPARRVLFSSFIIQ